MGEAKRRKEALGEQYGQEAKFISWLPITKSQSQQFMHCLLYTSPSPRDKRQSRMPSSA